MRVIDNQNRCRVLRDRPDPLSTPSKSCVLALRQAGGGRGGLEVCRRLQALHRTHYGLDIAALFFLPVKLRWYIPGTRQTFLSPQGLEALIRESASFRGQAMRVH